MIEMMRGCLVLSDKGLAYVGYADKAENKILMGWSFLLSTKKQLIIYLRIACLPN